MTEAVLFDFNGVLVDDESQHCDALRSVLADEGLTLSREEYYADYLGLDDRTGFVQAFQRANRTMTTELLDRLVEGKSRIYQRLIERSLTMVPGADEFVRDAGKRYRLGIVSGALRHEIDLVLSHTTIADRFEVIVAAGDVSRCKPDPAGFLAAHAAFNRHSRQAPIAARACVVIEDSLPGLAAARAAGMPCVMLATSHSPETLRQRGAALVWQSLSGHTAAELAEL
ncbi:MAG TPA: HAD family phosphatase [Gemmatimonadales bacterium]|nr:HAD family phosphatase [Gemmatimonadales bacterium]